MDNSETNRTGVLERAAADRVDVRLLRKPPIPVVPPETVVGLATRLAPSFYLDVGNVCNQSCIYCAVERAALYRTPPDSARTCGNRAIDHGFTTCTLIGGEPTIWPHLFAVLSHLKKSGMERAVLTTNGLMLAYPRYLPRLEEHGIDTVGLSFDDMDPYCQRTLSRREDVPELLATAVENLSTSPLFTYFYAVATKFLRARGGDYAEGALALASRFDNPPAFVFGAFKPVASGLMNLEELDWPLAEAAKEVSQILDLLQSRVTVAFRDFPLCLFPEHLGLSLDLYHSHATLDLTSGDVAVDSRSKTFGRVCNSCSLKSCCPGVHRSYIERHGEGEFKAFV